MEIKAASNMSQCQALRVIERGVKNQVYSHGTAQFHWGVTPRDKWVLFDVKKDPDIFPCNSPNF